MTLQWLLNKKYELCPHIGKIYFTKAIWSVLFMNSVLEDYLIFWPFVKEIKTGRWDESSLAEYSSGRLVKEYLEPLRSWQHFDSTISKFENTLPARWKGSLDLIKIKTQLVSSSPCVIYHILWFSLSSECCLRLFPVFLNWIKLQIIINTLYQVTLPATSHIPAILFRYVD